MVAAWRLSLRAGATLRTRAGILRPSPRSAAQHDGDTASAKRRTASSCRVGFPREGKIVPVCVVAMYRSRSAALFSLPPTARPALLLLLSILLETTPPHAPPRTRAATRARAHNTRYARPASRASPSAALSAANPSAPGLPVGLSCWNGLGRVAPSSFFISSCRRSVMSVHTCAAHQHTCSLLVQGRSSTVLPPCWRAA
jgi:hypothetical protein